MNLLELAARFEAEEKAAAQRTETEERAARYRATTEANDAIWSGRN